ncbi:MAG: thermitase, partial [Actinomycetota bacterium]|nr:thermitase [Actinomycetota bacterium]
RTEPRILAAAVRPGRLVRVATVHVDSFGARVDVTEATGPVEAERRITTAQADPSVVAVQIDRRVRALRIPSLPRTGAVAPESTTSSGPTTSPEPAAARETGVVTEGGVPALSDDPLRGEQWALDQLSAERVWTVSRGASQVVAVIDSGVDSTHPDLASQLMPGTDLVARGGDGWTDPYGHGTHVAGIIAARAGNKVGIAGLAPDARILPVRVLDANGEGWDSDIADGVIWSADSGADVINLSLGGPGASEVVRSAVLYAVGRGAVVVAAAGNERTKGNPVNYPAGFDLAGQLAVAATTRDRVSASYSNTGPYVTIAAPGDGIVSTVRGTYEQKSGTSMATPYASAAVALLRAVSPSLPPADVISAFVSTADDLEASGRDDATGNGLIDPVGALCGIGRCPGANPSPTGSPSPSPMSSPTGSPSPSPTGSPSPSPTGSPSPSPGDDPPTGVTEPLRVGVRATPATIVAGATTTLLMTVSDAKGPVAGAVVRVAGAGRSAVGRTGKDGTARIVVGAPITAVWSVTATADGHAVLTRLKVPVAPRVVVRWAGSRVTVSVSPARRQTVSVVQGSSVRGRGRLGWSTSGRMTLPVPRSGRVRLVVGAGGGLVTVTVQR